MTSKCSFTSSKLRFLEHFRLDLESLAYFAPATNYDFSADQFSLAPYIHSEWQAAKKLRFEAGLRFDYFEVDYQDTLSADVAEQQAGGADRFTHLRPADQRLNFEHLSPKLGTVYALTPQQTFYATYRHSFRAPATGTLFRSGSTTNTDELNPVKIDSFEIGTRGTWARIQYDIALYHMMIDDDVVSYVDQASLDRKVTNAGETEHQGIEVSLAKRLNPEWSFALSLSYTEQEYVDFIALQGFPAREVNYGSNDVPRAPKTLSSVSLQYEPLVLFGSTFELEVNQLGDYYTDEANSQTYGGHTTAQILATYPVNHQLSVYGRVANLTDKIYSTYTSNQVGDPELAYRPGEPRAFFVGVNYTLKGQ